MRASGLGIIIGADERGAVNCERLVIDNPLLPQLFEKQADVGANLLRVRVAKLGLQLCDDLAEGALAVAALEYQQAGIAQAKRALRIQDHAFWFAASFIFLFCAPTAASGQAG